MSNLSLHCQHQLNLFRRQYFQLELDPRYPDPEYLRLESFQNFLQKVLFDEDFVEYQPPRRYQIRVLKELMKRIEASITDWEVENKSTPTITLLEARNLLTATGTTDFRTWEACLYLGACLSSPSCTIPIANQSVLELGAGTGHLSILCAKYLAAAHVTATNGSESIVADLATNFFLNGLQDNSAIEAKELKWGQALLGGEQAEWNQARPVNTILGADVTYDSKGIPALIATLIDLIGMFRPVKILIASTIRNEETFRIFVKVCGMNGFEVEELDFPVMPREDQDGPFYHDEVPMKLCNIKRIE